MNIVKRVLLVGSVVLFAGCGVVSIPLSITAPSDVSIGEQVAVTVLVEDSSAVYGEIYSVDLTYSQGDGGDGIVISSKEITLEAAKENTLPFTWSTSALKEDTYLLTAMIYQGDPTEGIVPLGEISQGCILRASA